MTSYLYAKITEIILPSKLAQEINLVKKELAKNVLLFSNINELK